MSTDQVWIAVADYGLNGYDVLGVWADRPTDGEIDALADRKFAYTLYTPRDITGFSGITIDAYQVL